MSEATNLSRRRLLQYLGLAAVATATVPEWLLEVENGKLTPADIKVRYESIYSNMLLINDDSSCAVFVRS